jgi:ferredoxin-type protein NapF
VDEIAFTEGCTRCAACIDACPESILIAASGGYPEVTFIRGECTFCGDCVTACPAPVFENTQSTPWQLKVMLDEQCLAHKQVVCRSCGENCEAEAIRFELGARGVGIPQVDPDCCTGCGACLSVCPTQAITLIPQVIGTIPSESHQRER